MIEERVASMASERHARFEDVNLELVRVSDLVVCLLPAEATAGKKGGTRDVLALARRWHWPVLELRVRLNAADQPELTEQWHWNPAPDAPAEQMQGFTLPDLPAPLNQITCDECDLKDAAGYRATLKHFASRAVADRRSRFKGAALIIVGAHVAATALALVALKTHGETALLETAATENEFATLALQTESRLLGETANWYARRTFTGIA